MSEKLISADDVLKHTVLAGEIRNQYMEVVPAYFLRDAPAADAVEVVRCDKCARGIVLSHSDNVVCAGRKMPKNGFCSYGLERR